MQVPGYWMDETTGVLRPAVEAYLRGEAMTRGQIAAMRAYLRQWMRGDWRGEEVDDLKLRVDRIESRADLATWLRDAAVICIDPL